MKQSKTLIATFCLIFLSAFITLGTQKKPWPVPDAAKKKPNPVANTAASVNEGKALWNTHCKSCHGTKGLGDGPKSAQLNTDPGDFTKSDFQGQTDGSLFYKTSTGRDDMPAYKAKIPDPDNIWSLVNFMRTFRKGEAPKVVTTPVKDTAKTVVKPTEKPVVTTNPPTKKETEIKKNVTPTVQEQLNNLSKRMDSLERVINVLRFRLDSLHK